MKGLEQQVGEYAATLTGFVREHDLPGEWFMSPDHLAVKGADADGFDELIRQAHSDAMQISCIDMDGRRLATAHLKEEITVGVFGQVGWLEIMEPRPEKIGNDVVGLEHMEFYYPHFERITDVLKQRKISYEPEKKPNHSAIVIVINEHGQEVKLNDNPLGKTVLEEIDSGLSYIL